MRMLISALGLVVVLVGCGDRVEGGADSDPLWQVSGSAEFPSWFYLDADHASETESLQVLLGPDSIPPWSFESALSIEFSWVLETDGAESPSGLVEVALSEASAGRVETSITLSEPLAPASVSLMLDDALAACVYGEACSLTFSVASELGGEGVRAVGDAKVDAWVVAEGGPAPDSSALDIYAL